MSRQSRNYIFGVLAMLALLSAAVPIISGLLQ